MAKICYQKGREQGHWYELQCIKNDILSKESRGEDAKFERDLLRGWSKFPGWGAASDVLSSLKKSKSTKVGATL